MLAMRSVLHLKQFIWTKDMGSDSNIAKTKVLTAYN